jgi:AAA+ superfamily predicted ATPase
MILSDSRYGNLAQEKRISMTSIPNPPADRQALLQAIGRTRQQLEHQAQSKVEELSPQPSPEQSETQYPNEPSALSRLCALFHLSNFERDILLLCAGMELDPVFRVLCAQIHQDVRLAHPTFSLALETLPDPDLTALHPDAPLRHWQLIQVKEALTLTLSPLQIDEAILHFLLGQPCIPSGLKGVIQPLPTKALFSLSPSQLEIAAQVGALWSAQAHAIVSPVVQLWGKDTATHLEIAKTIAQKLGWQCARLSADQLPTLLTEQTKLQHLWQREVRLSGQLLVLDCTATNLTEPGVGSRLAQFVAAAESPLLLLSRDRLHLPDFLGMTLEVPTLSSYEQQNLWVTHLGDRRPDLNGQVAKLVSQFNLNAPVIRSICAQALSQAEGEGAADDLGDRLWRYCRIQSRPNLEALAQRIATTATLEDLILPDDRKQVLQTIIHQVRHRAKVYQEWGFAQRSQRGLGTIALFSGSSGMGKTMAAEVLAHTLNLDLYRIDLSATVSKYIGETEKHLAQIFDAAETGGVVLLFDEADAIFGKRSDVKDSHDRYANMEVSYLLQRLEAYQGLAILTTNLKAAIDSAFQRRIRFMVEFPPLDFRSQVAIWQRAFPAQTPIEGVDFNKLGQANLSGGSIRNASLQAAFLAAEAEKPVQMHHVLLAVHAECRKTGTLLPDGLVQGLRDAQAMAVVGRSGL